jgi:UDP-N-acetylglucosamine:LPS N-acetylglucosamine transferase
LLADAARRRAMGEAARTLGRPDATERFADLVEATSRPARPARKERGR